MPGRAELNTSSFEPYFTPEALAEVRAKAEFTNAIEGLAAGSLGEYAQANEAGRWMYRDLGRSTLYLVSVLLHGAPGGLTCAALAAAAKSGKFASRGRVIAFLQHAESFGELEAEPGPQPWIRRRLHPRGDFLPRFREANRVYAVMAAKLWPELAVLLDRFDDDAFFLALIYWVAVLSRTPGALPGPEVMFLERDRGTSILFRLMLSQARPRPRLLMEAPISRSSLSREFEVSRIHVNRLLADASAAGLLTVPEPDRVVFSELLSDAVERMLAATLQLTRASLLAAAAS